MNQVSLIGRLVRDPEVRYSGEMAIAKFTVAVDRQKKEPGADFPSVVCFGKTAELVEKYVKKGRLVGIQGHIQTGSYDDKSGRKVYTTEVVADRVEFLDRAGEAEPTAPRETENKGRIKPSEDDYQMGFTKMIDGDEIPFGG